MTIDGTTHINICFLTMVHEPLEGIRHINGTKERFGLKTVEKEK